MSMAETERKLTVRNLSRENVLEDISFDVYENEFLVILGPGQCGKTTLLNMMAEMEEETSFVFQRYGLFNWKNVLQNVAAPLKYKGVDKKTRNRVARKYIDLVGLTGFENAYPAQLSGGMKQRVGIARAYAGGNSIILMDEPFSALDAQTRYQMQDEILKIRNKEKATIVFVTNNIEEAITFSDRILLFSSKPGRIVKEYIPDLKRPRSHTSREFMNLRNDISDHMDLVL